MHGSVQFIIKASSVFERNSSSRSTIVSCCSLIWVLANVASSEVLSRYSTSILRYIVFGQLPVKYIHFFFLHCSGSACSDCTEGSGSSILVVFENFLAFYFSFSPFPTIISSSFFLILVISLLIPEVFHFQCCNQ